MNTPNEDTTLNPKTGLSAEDFQKEIHHRLSKITPPNIRALGAGDTIAAGLLQTQIQLLFTLTQQLDHLILVLTPAKEPSKPSPDSSPAA